MATPKDIVPFSELLPSAEVFGPEVAKKSKKDAAKKAASKNRSTESKPARAQRPRPDAPRQQRPAPQGQRPAPQAQRPVQQRSTQQAQRPVQGRPAVAERPVAPASQAPAPQAPAPRQARRGAPVFAAAKDRPAAARPAAAAPAPKPARPTQRPDDRSHRSSSPLSRQSKQYDNEYFHEFDGQRESTQVRPQTGWRGALLKTTGLNVGASAEERLAAANLAKMRQKVSEGSIAVFSRKGGVGKTTISAYLSTTLASLRGGRIVALDGDAEAGSLGWLLAPKAPATLNALAQAAPSITDYRQLRNFVTTTDEGLDVIVGEAAENGVLSAAGMQAVADQVSRHYDLSIFDTGAGVTRATGAVLVHQARVLLLVMGPSVDSVRAAERTLAWLEERPGVAAHPNAQVIAVINGIPSDAKETHIQRIESHFADRCAAVARIPWDASLAQGTTDVSLEALSKDTRLAFENLAATTVNVLSQKGQKAGNLGVRRAS